MKRYTDPSSLRKHVKNHTREEQEQVRLRKETVKTGVKALKNNEEWKNDLRSMSCTGQGGHMSGGGVVSTSECEQLYTYPYLPSPPPSYSSSMYLHSIA